MVLVFDLDDTLYEEITFVKSGFKQVAKFLEDSYQIPKNDSFEFMLLELKKGRGKIFDNLLIKYNSYSARLIRRCISVYRLHKPDIKLSGDAINCIKRTKNLSKYIVTDGNKFVQKNKIESLKLARYFKGIFITHRYGLKNAKPSVYCFDLICKKEGVSPDQVVYVGDDPAKDFIGLKPRGFKTIRILRGNHKEVRKSIDFEADINIKSLKQLTPNLLKKLTK
jgi:putative hydrolase of the HAD superfamily